MDKWTMLDSIVYSVPEHALIHYYTVEGTLDEDTLYQNTSEQGIASVMDGLLLENLRTSIPLKDYKEEGIIFRYTYYSKKNGQVVLDFRYTPEDYR